MENTFRIIFSGEVLPGTDIHDVRRKIAALPGIDEALAEACISGTQPFSMDGLDFVTARKYEKGFERAGAVCAVSPMYTCPVCGYRQPELRQCPWCEHRQDGPDAEEAVLPERMAAVAEAENAPEAASPQEMHKILTRQINTQTMLHKQFFYV
ncbi:hypothetical protein DENIS_4220 [Desulfonema ishimotonii]|uniref:Uncharacterized protein n=1 Tax=Desulfonema ishimotonii TaxID=45657 RepID=A0A401G204_9BACT|nr:hypothetical protein [Desulfonema ishimotonii]GBC63226.1 hypothetical protein DENIS_4220 [Desulfonema ishimotonii]